MLKFGKVKVRKEGCCDTKKPLKTWNFSVYDIVIPKLIKKNNSKYFTGYLEDVARPHAFVLPKLSGYVRAFKQTR